MELDQPENCAKCGTLPEDILMLTCSHDLCLTCSARNFQREVQKKGRSANAIFCELCGALTVLDESSIQELQRIANSLPSERSTSRNDNPNGVSPSLPANKFYQKPSETTERPIDESRLTTTSKVFDHSMNDNLGSGQFNVSRAVRGYCSEHPDEEISYFCFDCLSNCICPECVIHGAHKNHEVKTVKKAYPLVRAKVEDAMAHMSSKLEELRGLEDKVEGHKIQAIDSAKTVKKQISEMFMDLRQRLDRKEKELMQSVDKMLDDAVKELDGSSKQIKNKTFSINSSLEILQNHFGNKEETSLLNFYANNRDKLHYNFSTDDIAAKRMPEGPNFRHSHAVSEVAEALTALQEQISSISMETVGFSEKNQRRNELGNNVLNNYNRQPPVQNINPANQNYSKPHQKNSQNVPMHQGTNPADFRKTDRKRQDVENGDSVAYGTFGTYGNTTKGQNVRYYHE